MIKLYSRNNCGLVPDETVGACCFGCLSGPQGFTCLTSFAHVLVLFTVESLSLLYLLVVPLCAAVYVCLLVTCRERADLVALVCGV